jgi:hypothetical protein
MNEVTLNPKQIANRIMAGYLEKMEVGDAAKLRATHKISQNDATLVFAYLTMAKAETIGRFTRVKKSKALEAGKETEETK